jgi:hypothetical protein
MAMSEALVFKLSDKNVIEISDDGNGITLKNSSGAVIRVNDSGIEISNGKGASIKLTGPTVDINSGALTVD